MATDSWINETLYPDWGQRFLVKRELARVQSAFQDIVIFESSSHGRVMLLDGVVQITEADEFVYQEMLTHVPLLAHGAAANVLIIGAGDGGVLRRVLQHRSVRRAVMVEIDGEVIRLSKEFLPAIGGDAWTDPRAEVIVGDGIDYVKRAPDATFDAIIVDSTDPIGVGEVLFTDEFYANCARILTARGLVVNQCGVPFMQADELRETSARRAKFFPHVTAYVAAVPTYVGGFMTLGWAAKDATLTRVGVDEIRARAAGRRHSWRHALLDAGDPRRGVQPAALYRAASADDSVACMSASLKPLTLDEFLDWERSQPERYEFDGIQPVAMTGGSRAHSRVGTRLVVALGNRVKPPCEAHGPDLKVLTGARVRYPDASVVCSDSDDAKRYHRAINRLRSLVAVHGLDRSAGEGNRIRSRATRHGLRAAGAGPRGGHD